MSEEINDTPVEAPKKRIRRKRWVFIGPGIAYFEGRPVYTGQGVLSLNQPGPAWKQDGKD